MPVLTAKALVDVRFVPALARDCPRTVELRIAFLPTSYSRVKRIYSARVYSKGILFAYE